jgi:hypothetical protein
MKNWLRLLLIIGLLAILWFIPHSYRAHITNTENTAIVTFGDGSDPADPLPIALDTYYGDGWKDYFTSHDTRYLVFPVQANELYFIYFDDPMWWDLELYFDPGFSYLLGTPYKVPEGGIFNEYLFFSPNHTGSYSPTWNWSSSPQPPIPSIDQNS